MGMGLQAGRGRRGVSFTGMGLQAGRGGRGVCFTGTGLQAGKMACSGDDGEDGCRTL